jgi:hypothetical protein
VPQVLFFESIFNNFRTYEHRDLPEEFRIDRKKLNYQVSGKNKEHEGKKL